MKDLIEDFLQKSYAILEDAKEAILLLNSQLSIIQNYYPDFKQPSDEVLDEWLMGLRDKLIEQRQCHVIITKLDDLLVELDAYFEFKIMEPQQRYLYDMPKQMVIYFKNK